ncbi:C40 family peptidase [Fredinandcohnia onubensis]|uniref:C40 family peptidase n=1 Tax=Fredinandcohnia onubensis TaxID=1571209 RepID=UPI000C0BCAAF|nr:C40 family peptidase [Fredinandcohnia onubensis]
MMINKIINTGLKHLGKPYVFNAPSFQTESFDCSSFIQYIFGVHGILLPRNSRQQFRFGERIPFQNIKKGDLLFFTTKKRKKLKGIERIGHIAIYIGDDKILHAVRPDKEVKISILSDYWKSVYLAAKRVI